MPERAPLPSTLYAILDVDLVAARRLDPGRVLDDWLDAGIRLVQLRAKHLSLGPMLDLAEAMAAACRAAGATFIVNDRADVARLSGAAGVHVGQEDLSVSDIRTIIGSDAIIGKSTHTLAQLAEVLDEDVGYVAFGPIFATRTKAHADPVVGLQGLRDAAQRTRSRGIPLVAIGGIRLESAAEVFEAGADAVAIASDLVGRTAIPGTFLSGAPGGRSQG